MCQIIQLQEYRERQLRPAQKNRIRALWACGQCGGLNWTAAVDGTLRCADCDARASNVEAIEIPAAPAEIL